MSAYYNEHDKFNVEWLKHLMAANLIASGEIDGRDIQDVRAEDLRGFTQCHFFAGIGVWSYALRCAGWPDSERVWTGSCPCQPFSVSGKRAGASDERHLWPEFFRLIAIEKPLTIFGEQVASDDGLAWLDLVSSDLEGQGYTVGAVDTPACGFGAPHRRQRLYWVADSDGVRCRRTFVAHEVERSALLRDGSSCGDAGAMRPESILADSDGGNEGDRDLQRSRKYGLLAESRGVSQLADPSGRRREQCDPSKRMLQLADENRVMGHAADSRRTRPEVRGSASGDARQGSWSSESERAEQTGDMEHASRGGRRECGDATQPRSSGHDHSTGILNGFWKAAEWLWCRDEKHRPVEPGTFPLAHGIANRVGKLRGYGNALVAPQAEGFIRAYMETLV